MLVVSEKQMSSMTSELKRLSTMAVSATLRMQDPEWCRDRSDEEIEEFSASLCALFLAHGILQKENMVRLVELKIRHDYQIPLSNYRSMVLSLKGFSEEYRIKRFEEDMVDKFSLININYGD